MMFHITDKQSFDIFIMQSNVNKIRALKYIIEYKSPYLTLNELLNMELHLSKKDFTDVDYKYLQEVWARYNKIN